MSSTTLQIQSSQEILFPKFDFQGLQVLDENNNGYYVDIMLQLKINIIFGVVIKKLMRVMN